ncbi:glycosyltransferase [Chryseobacterium salivictor]|uniref:Glycosyltransferase 2-like domain-containing protein n=1 Tax=Chryseobacterium salivictor TaxID=2547600 RepID=A0A4P6ZD64_9FLAO|nr:glycosyltransferase family 2 protein [Chryseobacterium salivictor]QBO57480.1 hypothetical protein NBC122_00644 [Chryseobacterium salivictor]
MLSFEILTTVNNLAIIIPFYKKKYFEKTLKSLVNQSERNFSVYIGNDNSPDDIEDLLSEYADQLNFKYKKFSQNLGADYLTLQWDRCIALSDKEEWIMILGDDDVLGGNFVEEFYSHLDRVETSKIKVIRYASQLIDEADRKTSEIYYNPELEKAGTSYIRTLKGKGRSTLSEHIFARSAYDKHGFKHFPVAFGSDNVAWLEFPDMENIYSINTAVVSVRISKEHLSSREDNGLKYKRREGIYLFNRYIIENYALFFTKEEKFLILKKAYRNLRFATRNKLKTFEFLFFMFRKIGWKTVDIIKNNRYKD